MRFVRLVLLVIGLTLAVASAPAAVSAGSARTAHHFIAPNRA